MYLAVDIGSSFIKLAAIYEKDIVLIQKTATPQPVNTLDGAFELDSNEIINIVKTLLDRQIEALTGIEGIEGILISTQMHGVVPCVDGKMQPYISWQDRRCLRKTALNQSWLDDLQALISPAEMMPCGVYLKGSMGLCNLSVFLQENGIAPSACEVFTLGSFVIHQLCGKNSTHVTNAAPIGCYDLVQQVWDSSILKKMGMEGIRLPEVLHAMEPVGQYKGIFIYPDIGDQQAAILGSGTEMQDVNVNIGTAGQLSAIIDSFVPPPPGAEVRPYFDGRYLLTVTDLPSGRNLEVLVDFLWKTAEFATGSSIDKNSIWEKLCHISLPEKTSLEVSLDFFRSGGSVNAAVKDNLVPEQLISGAFQYIAQEYRKAYQKLSLTKGGIVFCGGLPERIAAIPAFVSRDLGIDNYKISQTDVFWGLKKLLEGIKK